MTDIVERLRACHGIHSGDPECCCEEAADEIKQLREEGTVELVKAMMKIDRLQAALTELLSGHDNLYVAYFGPNSNPRDDIAAKPARRALEPKP